ncbi:MAG: DUF11 domain-containing protein [Deltaproteobacteria bacterium]|nr:DUF11 domain-containing protein [Deltaproteobacteria bacterium]
MTQPVSDKKTKARAALMKARLRIAAAFTVLAAILGIDAYVYAHSVGQVQTTKYFTPETVQMLVDNAAAGSPGLHAGDTVSYIIQFSPIANGATTGVAGYITDYVPSGVEVIGASIVAMDGSGNFYDVAPGLPGGIDTGWGNRGQNTFLAPFNAAGYDSTGRCTTAGYTNNCNARMTELYADTGIFFSTDSRTSQYPAMPTRIAQGTNGYNIDPTGAAGLNTLLNQLSATTHNLWDADQTNAFGSTAAAVGALAAPKSSQTALSTGKGATPYNAGSAVAGPQTGYQLDNTGQIGPWQRIYYSGSRMGDDTLGPATVAGSCTTCVGGYSTSVGWNLSSGNPLPSGTNAVRWAVGKLVVGSVSYVKITMRITGAPPSSGLINSSEVFGGDAGDADGGQDNTWRYHVPSVADNNSNLYVLKTVICVYSGAACNSSTGTYIPANAKVRYRSVYLNSGNANQTNVVLSDTLPCQTAANPVSNITVISGPLSTAINPAAPGAGACPGTRQTFSFNNGAGVTLLPAGGGSIEYDVQTNAALTNIVTNTAKLTSAALPSGVTSNANSYVQAAPNLTITKTTGTPSVSPGGTATYTITIANTGTAATTSAANGLIVYDILPSTGGAVNAATRFSYSSTSSITGLTSVVPATTGPPPTLTPYNSGGTSSNQQQVQWNFGLQTLAAGASATITYNAAVGASVTASATPYYNTAVVTYYNGAVLNRTDATSVAGVTVTSPLSVTKTIESYYDAATLAWVPYGSNIPANAKVRYRIDYANTGAVAIANANISDTLPCQTAANPVSNVQIISGPIGAPAPNPPVVAAGNCATSTRQTFSFTAAPSLSAGQTGQIRLDVQTNAATGNTVVNTATMTGTGAAAVSSETQASALSAPLLTIAKTASVPGVAQGGTLSYTITVANTGTANATGIVLYDWLPSGGAALNAATRFSYSSTTSITGMTSVAPTVVTPPTLAPYSTDVNAANMQQIAWNFGVQTLAPGASFTVVFAASVGASVPVSTSYNNNARVYYGTEQANSGAVSVAVGSNLSTSAKTVVDLNGGDVAPGDVLEYTITLNETAGIAASGVSVTDNVPANVNSFTVTAVPAGSTDSSTAAPTGLYSDGYLNVTNISVPANGTAAVVFRVTVAAGTPSGTQIDNTATVTNPTGVGGTPAAPTLTVLASIIAGFGNKPLYLYDAVTYKLSRAKPGAGGTISIAAAGFQTWTLNPALASSVTISNAVSTTVPAQLYLSKAVAATYNVTVDLYCGAALVTSLTQSTALTATPALFTFNLPLAAPYTCAAASSWAVRVANGGALAITLTPYVSAAQISNVSLPSQSVIDVTSVTPYNTVYPGVGQPPLSAYAAGSTVYLRAVVSDPFGSYDIDANNNSTTQPTITIKDSSGATIVNSAAMGAPVASDASTKTYEYAYVISGPTGWWTATVTAKEGTEDAVSDAGIGAFDVVVLMPSLMVMKSVQTISDPVNGASPNAKAIPGAVMLYTVSVTNSGSGAAESVVMTDPRPANTKLYVNDVNGPGSGPVLFVDGATPSGLTYSFVNLASAADCVGFSNDGGTTWTYTPVPDADGYDAAVTNIAVSLTNSFNAASGGNNPSFSLKFRVRVN